jgi:hypothetical protein
MIDIGVALTWAALSAASVKALAMLARATVVGDDEEATSLQDEPSFALAGGSEFALMGRPLALAGGSSLALESDSYQGLAGESTLGFVGLRSIGAPPSPLSPMRTLAVSTDISSRARARL